MVAINQFFFIMGNQFFLLTTMIFLVLHGNHVFLLIVLPYNIQFSYLFHSFRQLDSIVCLDTALYIACIVGNSNSPLVCVIVSLDLTYIYI